MDRSRIAFSALALVTLIAAAHAADQLTPGKKLDVRAGGKEIVVARVRITDAGRRALEG